MENDQKLPLTSGRAEENALPGHSGSTCSLDDARAGALLGKAHYKEEQSA